MMFQRQALFPPSEMGGGSTY